MGTRRTSAGVPRPQESAPPLLRTSLHMARPLDTHERVCTPCTVLNTHLSVLDTPKRVIHTSKSVRHTPGRVPDTHSRRRCQKNILVVQSRAGSQEVGVINNNECSVLSTIEAGPRSSLGVKLIYIWVRARARSRDGRRQGPRVFPFLALSRPLSFVLALSLSIFRSLTRYLALSHSLSRTLLPYLSLSRTLSLALACKCSF